MLMLLKWVLVKTDWKQIKIDSKENTKILFFCLLLATLSSNFNKVTGQHKSKNLVIHQLTQNTFQHISYLYLPIYGKIPCNGLIVKSGDRAVVLDSPANPAAATELIGWINEALRCEVIGVVATHFHDDCLGGLAAFHELDIPSYSHHTTQALAKEHGYTIPENGFEEEYNFILSNNTVQLRFFGGGHTKDNIVGYYAKENVLFGGCLIKAMNAQKGNLEDAVISEWSTTVENVKTTYPEVKHVVPGHGEPGGKELLDYTITLFGQ